MTSKSILVIGANRGIGLNLIKSFSKRGWNLFGTTRPQTVAAGDESVKELEATGAEIFELDYCDEETIAAAAKKLGSRPINVLVNCAGVPPEVEDFFKHTKEIVETKLKVMAVGPFLTSKYFAPNVIASGDGAIVNITSILGSMSLTEGGFVAYSMAKAAVNALTVTLSMQLKEENKNVAVIALNPGYVATRLTGFRSRNDMDKCIAGMTEIIENLTMAQTGKFIRWDGEDQSW